MNCVRIAFALSVWGTTMNGAPKNVSPPPIGEPHPPSQPLVPIAVPKNTRPTQGRKADIRLAADLSLSPCAVAAPRPVDMKLLVITVDGTEPSYQAITTFLKQIGVPYQSVLSQTQPLPVLNDATKGFYQGIILVTGNLGVCDPTCRSALSQADWNRLDLYSVNFGVRTVSYYTFPEPRYGMAYTSAVSSSSAAPQFASFTAAAAQLFSSLNRTNPVKVTDAYVYFGAVYPIAGATTTPVLLAGNGGILGALFNDSDGSESLALTMDNNPNLLHSLLFNYGLVSWLTRGKFLGSRKAYLTPQIDDLFLENDLFDSTVAACVPVGFVTDPTSNLADQCATVKISNADVTGLVNWQNTVRGNAQSATFKSAFAYNGYGYTSDGGGGDAQDPLRIEVIRQGTNLNLLNHTWDHENLDCYAPVPNSGICRPATYAESFTEVSLNDNDARAIGLTIDRASMVTPNISGLNNPDAMRAAFAAGIRYVVTDASRPEGAPPSPNAGIWNRWQSGILMIPRRANNVFYNVAARNRDANGSWPDEFNYFYGPNGIFRIGGPGGAPFFTTNQTYDQIVDFESDNLLRNILRYELYPLMFHQSNVYRYNAVNSIFTDVMDRTLQKFRALAAIPLGSLRQTDIGVAVRERMSYDASGATATWTPGVGITLRAVNAAVIPVTGACGQNCTTYAGESQSRVSLTAGQSVTIAAP